MKKTAAALLACLALTLGACSSNESTTSDSSSADQSSSATSTSAASSASSSAESSTASAEASLTPSDGVLTSTDTEANIEDGSGVRITIEPGATGTATFQLIDPSTGADYSDYFVFDYSDRTFQRHHYASSRGSMYVYVMNLDDQTLTEIQNDSGEDVSATIREHGRWDPAQDETAEALNASEEYFSEHYGMTVEEATTQS